MKTKLIEMLLGSLMTMLTPELLQKFADMALDFFEDLVKDSSNTIDDKIVLPICDSIRKAFNIPDDDDV